WAVGSAAGGSTICFEFASPIGDGQDTVLRFTLSQLHGDNHVLGRFRLSATSSAKPVRAPAVVLPPQEIRDIIQLEPARRDDPQKAKLTGHFKNTTPALFDLRSRLAQAKQAQSDFEGRLPRCLVS